MMWRASRRLISSTSAASVVDLPEPVGPPISTSPRGSATSASTPGGRPSDGEPRHAAGSARMAAAARPRSRCRLMRKRPSAGEPVGRVGDAGVAVLRAGVRRQRRQRPRPRSSSPSSGAPPSGTTRAVDPDRGGRAGDEQQIAAAAGHQLAQPRVEPGAITAARGAVPGAGDGGRRPAARGRPARRAARGGALRDPQVRSWFAHG